MSNSNDIESSLEDLKSKVDILLSVVRNQDLNIKILSNKLNLLLNSMAQTQLQNQSQTSPNISVEADNVLPSKNIFVSSEDKIKIESEPVGFRRTSRPETFKQPEIKKPTSEKKTSNEVVEVLVNVPANIIENKPTEFTGNTVPVEQRVIDKNGKSIFLADVEVIDTKTGEKVSKVRTNGAGKWSCALHPGNYKIIISKRDSISKEKSEMMQDLYVDGKTTPLKLSTLSFK